MAIVRATNLGGVPDIDPGVYDAVCLDVEDAQDDGRFEAKPGQIGRRVATFRLSGVPNDTGEPVKLRKWYTLYLDLGAKTDAYQMFSAMLFGGQPIPEGEELDDDDFKGKRCRVQWGRKQKGEGMGITAFYPPKAKQAAPVGAGARRTVTEEDIDAI